MEGARRELGLELVGGASLGNCRRFALIDCEGMSVSGIFARPLRHLESQPWPPGNPPKGQGIKFLVREAQDSPLGVFNLEILVVSPAVPFIHQGYDVFAVRLGLVKQLSGHLPLTWSSRQTVQSSAMHSNHSLPSLVSMGIGRKRIL